jgi:hypothetical protein
MNAKRNSELPGRFLALVALAVGHQKIGPLGPKTCEATTRHGRPCAGHPRGWARRAPGRPAAAKSLESVGLCSGAAWLAETSPVITTGDRRHASDCGSPIANAYEKNSLFLKIEIHAILLFAMTDMNESARGPATADAVCRPRAGLCGVSLTVSEAAAKRFFCPEVAITR